MKVISRMAPTPSGYLHLGNLMNFAMTWAMTRREEGELWLRIDDGDAARAKPEYTQDILDTLQWLGLTWDKRLGSQTERRKLYWNWLQKFPHYVCDCSRKQIEARAGDQLYDGHCRQRGLKFEPLKTQIRILSADPQCDQVLWRKENGPAYQLASLVDDLTCQVNLIVRGEDLRESTQVQREMARILGPEGESFLQARIIHHQLLKDEDGEKLAKSEGDLSLKTLREHGLSAAEVFALMVKASGWKTDARSIEDLVGFVFPEE